MKKQWTTAVLLAAFLSGSGLAHAQAMSVDQHDAAKKQIEADYKAGKAQCDALKDNAKDVCKKEAEAKERTAKAELDQQYKPSPKHQRDVEEAKAKGAYEVAEEKCDDSTGDAKSA